MTILIINKVILYWSDSAFKNVSAIFVFLASFYWALFLIQSELFFFESTQPVSTAGFATVQSLLTSIAVLNFCAVTYTWLQLVLIYPLQQRNQGQKVFENSKKSEKSHQYFQIEKRPWPEKFQRFHGIVPVIQMYDLQVMHRELHFKNLPEAFDGISIGHLSDFHLNSHVQHSYIDYVTDVYSEYNTDYTFVTGDFINRKSYIEKSIKNWLRTVDPERTFVIRGNHDFYSGPKKIKEELEYLGCRLLNDRAVEIERCGEKILIAGYEGPYSKSPDSKKVLQKVSDNNFRILLTHTPDNFLLVAEYGWDWVLAGHTHGGQFRLPWIGPIVVPSACGRRYTYGVFQKDRSILTVTSGLGAYLPIRFGTPPEIVIYKIYRCKG